MSQREKDNTGLSEVTNRSLVYMRQGFSTFVSILKRSYQTYKTPTDNSTRGKGISTQSSLIPKAFQSFSPNTIMVDFSGLDVAKDRAFILIKQAFQHIEVIEFIK